MSSRYGGQKLSQAQMQSALRAAGWPDSLIVTMGAIGQAESSGWTGAVNDNRPREYSVGVWQINLLAHPQYSEAQMNDPAQNAAAALAVYQVQGLRAWGPYITGVYKKYLSAAQAAYSAGAGPQADQGANSQDGAMQLGALAGGSAGAILLIGGLAFLYWYLSD